MLDPTQTVKGLAILAAIPLVLFALWSEYFVQYLQNLAKANPKFDRASELYKIRTASLLVAISEATLFLGTSNLQIEKRWLIHLAFVGVILTQAVIQGKTENKIRGDDSAKGKADLTLAVKSFFWFAVGGLIYVATMIVSLTLFAGIAKAAHGPAWLTTLILVTGVLTGIFGGIGICFALGPIFTRKTLPCAPLADEKVEALIAAEFKRAKLACPKIYRVDAEKYRSPNLMIAGFWRGRGFFSPALFISGEILAELSEAELRAALAHEIAHISLLHLRKRLLLSVGLILATTTLASFCVVLAHLIFPEAKAGQWVGTFVAGFAFVFTFKILSMQNRYHEIESDIFAVKSMGATIDSLEQALLKLHKLGGGSPTGVGAWLMSGMSHPTAEFRVKVLRAYFKKNPLPEPMSKDPAQDPIHDQAA